jgi:hypothetical protein
LSDEEILDRVSYIRSTPEVQELRELFASYHGDDITDEGRKAYEVLREKYLSRMWDLGKFMKYLKQHFSRWYNKTHNRKGTLWEERYNSSLVQEGFAELLVSSYIDLNPVRAGIVDDPKKYRWCSYASAVAGCQLSRASIASVLKRKDAACNPSVKPHEVSAQAEPHDPTEEVTPAENEGDLRHYKWRTFSNRYRLFLYEKGHAPGSSQRAKESQSAKSNHRKGFSSEAVEREKARGGQLSIAEKLNCRSRAWIDGAIIGTRGFIQETIVELNKNHYWKTPRKTSGSRMPQFGKLPAVDSSTSKGEDAKNNSRQGAEVEEMWTLRRLGEE